MSKDITVSKLSQLQKRVLVFARRAMIAKGQSITEREFSTIVFPAPEWLSTALTTAMEQVFRSRKIYQLGDTDVTGWHPWSAFFEEAHFVERAIRDAAKAAGVTTGAINLTRLHEIVSLWPLLKMHISGREMVYHPWPYPTRSGWEFMIEAKGSPDEVQEELKEHLVRLAYPDAVGDEKLAGIRVTRDPECPKNCTIPELLHELYRFPIKQDETAHIDALAFAPDEIGRGRYNTAQAALRRACHRLAERNLVVEYSGQSSLLRRGFYQRSGIGLTQSGVDVADRLIAPEPKAAATQKAAQAAPEPR
jgi:hypothetical protein